MDIMPQTIGLRKQGKYSQRVFCEQIGRGKAQAVILNREARYDRSRDQVPARLQPLSEYGQRPFLRLIKLGAKNAGQATDFARYSEIATHKAFDSRITTMAYKAHASGDFGLGIKAESVFTAPVYFVQMNPNPP